MPRILGVDIPNQKPTRVALTYLFGVGHTTAGRVCEQAGVDPVMRSKNLTDDELSRIAQVIESNYIVEGSLRRQITQNIARLREIGCYRGYRHSRGLPVRGQKTRTNARTRKGPKRLVAKKK